MLVTVMKIFMYLDMMVLPVLFYQLFIQHKLIVKMQDDMEKLHKHARELQMMLDIKKKPGQS